MTDDPTTQRAAAPADSPRWSTRRVVLLLAPLFLLLAVLAAFDTEWRFCLRLPASFGLAVPVVLAALLVYNLIAFGSVGARSATSRSSRTSSSRAPHSSASAPRARTSC